MSQLFSRRFDFLFRLALVAAVLAFSAAALAYRASVSAPIGDPVEQPIPFSHRHHVGDDGLDCRYCHTTVETSAFAGIPSTQVCMTCHSQLYDDAGMLAPVRESLASGEPLHWNRVHELPDFVFFDHGIHVAKGVGCETCHGRVDRMPLTWQAEPLTMQWCLDCHRDPGPHLRPQEAIYAMGWHEEDPGLGAELVRDYHLRSPGELSDCSVCHR